MQDAARCGGYARSEILGIHQYSKTYDIDPDELVELASLGRICI